MEMVIFGDDSDFERCEHSSDEDPDYTPSKTDMESDESSGWGHSGNESNDLDEVTQANVNPEQQNTDQRTNRRIGQETVQGTGKGTGQGKKQFSSKCLSAHSKAKVSHLQMSFLLVL